MAKRTPNRLLTDAFREIKNTRSRFVSLLVLSALAVCFLAGLRATEPDMKRSADWYFDEQRLMDLHILSTLGLTDADTGALAAVEGVEAVEPAYTIDAMLRHGDKEIIVKGLSYQEGGLNAPHLVEGRLPERADECLVEPDLLSENGLFIGDTITLDTGSGTYEDALAGENFTIVGTADSPLYVGVDRGSSSLGTGQVSAFVLLPAEAFTMESYTDIYVTLDGAAGLLCYDDAYTDLVEQMQDELEPFARERADLREAEVIGEANEKLADAEQELADAEAEADQELADAWQELTDARQELDDGWAEYEDGQQTLEEEIADAEQKIADGEEELADALEELEEGEERLEDGEDELADGWRQYNSGLAQYEAALAEFQPKKEEFDQGVALYESGYAEFQKSVEPLLPFLPGYDVDSLYNDLATKPGAVETILAGEEDKIQIQIGELPSKEELLQDLVGFESQTAEEILVICGEIEAQIAALDKTDTNYNENLSQLNAELERAKKAYKARLNYTLLEQLNESIVHIKSIEDALPGLISSVQDLNKLHLKIEENRPEIEAAQAQFEAQKAQLDASYQDLQDGEAELREGRIELQQGWDEYEDGLKDLEEARETLRIETADAEQELADALAELEDGEQEYADGLVEYEDGKAEAEQKIADARKELEQARRDIEAIEDCEWYVLGRNTNAGYVSYSMDADRMGNLASVFPLIFFLVAALVCLTTMTRMVEEERVTIGGLKALGYSRGAIAVKYVGYGFLASAIGSLLGLAVGLTLLPWIICNAWNIIYAVGPVQYGLEPVTSTAACLAAVGTVTLSALGACFSTLTAGPAELMRPKAPPAGKRVVLERIPWLWQRLSFNYKITIRNLFRYQRRFWMTVMGIGGCAALIVTAFGLRGSIFDIMDKQFDEIYGHTAQIGMVNAVTPTELREITDTLDGNALVDGWLLCRSETLSAQTEEYTVDATLMVAADQQALEPLIHLRHRTEDTPVTLPDDGVVLTEKLASLLGVGPGDSITLDGDERVEVVVADITEHYIQHYIYMTDAYYESVFGQVPEQNLILADYPTDDPDAESLERELVGLDGVSSLTRVEDTRNTYGSSLASVDYAVVLIIVCAAALAFVVLYNLTNINITERMRELATLKVLGFYDRELSAYIYRENVILTVFGVGIGMLMGKLLHQWLILTVEIDMLMFGRTLSLPSYLYAVVLTILFSLIVNLAAHRKLKHIDMVESLKTVE